MEGNFVDKYSFIGEWYDTQACLLRKFNVFYFPTDDTVEMYDLKNHKKFVRRMKVNGIALENFYIGCTLNILGRLVKIVGYACEDTRRKLQEELQITFAIIKPVPTNIVGKAITQLEENGLKVTKIKKVQLTPEEIHFVYKDIIRNPIFPFLVEYLRGNPVYGLELNGRHAVEKALKVVGERDPVQAEPGTIRNLHGTDAVHNCIDVAETHQSAMDNLQFFFNPSPQQSHLRLTPTLSNCTLCIAKPHAVREKKLGGIIEGIADGGFEITALNMLVVEIVNSAEFLEVYKGIVPEYKGMIDELSSGACVAMEIVVKDTTKHSAVEFRKLVGPSDPETVTLQGGRMISRKLREATGCKPQTIDHSGGPWGRPIFNSGLPQANKKILQDLKYEIAKLLRPHSLRAKFGVTKVKNAVHCSDLPEDGLLEVEYFFKILDM